MLNIPLYDVMLKSPIPPLVGHGSFLGTLPTEPHTSPAMVILGFTLKMLQTRRNLQAVHKSPVPCTQFLQWQHFPNHSTMQTLDRDVRVTEPCPGFFRLTCTHLHMGTSTQVQVKVILPHWWIPRTSLHQSAEPPITTRSFHSDIRTPHPQPCYS